jgi:alanine racemase
MHFMDVRLDEVSVARDKNIRPVINTSDEAMTQGIASLRPALHIDTGMRRIGDSTR